MNSVLKYVILVLSLFALGFLFMDYFAYASFYQIDTKGVEIQSLKVSEQFFGNLIFPISIGLIPLLYLVINRFVKLRKPYRLIAIGIIIFSGLLFWELRIFQLNNEFDRISKNLLDDVTITFTYKNFKFQMYLLIGFIVGTLINILIFKSFKKKILDQ